MTEDDLDDLEFETLRSGDHATAARRFVELSATVSGGVPRANLLLRAGEQWQHAGEPERAVEAYRSALEAGGATYGDPRVYLADALFEVGGVEEARTLIADVRAGASNDPEVYRAVAELLYEQGELTAAHEWATDGVAVARATDVESLEGILRIRYRCRLDLGLAEDEDDALLDDLLKRPRRQTPDQQLH